MKKLVFVSLFIFWAAVVSILTAGLIFYQKQNSSISQASPQSNSGQPNSGISGNNQIILSPAEVSKHNSPNDCWLIINNKIYNVTQYLNFHPGNPETITPYCGREATRAFDTKDKNKPHSTQANNLLNDYYVGDLNQPVTNQQIQSVIQKPQNSVSGSDEREDD